VCHNRAAGRQPRAVPRQPGSDNPMDSESIRIIGFNSLNAGHVHILHILAIADLDAEDMFVKTLVYLAKADAARILLGVHVLTSRADSVRNRMASCTVAVLYAGALHRAPDLGGA
jgi:phosphate acetyltransferase